MANTKMTKREAFTKVIAVLEAADAEVALVDAIKHEIELLDKKAEKAKANAKKGNAANDALAEAVAAVLDDEFKTVAEIAAKVEAEDATDAKVVYRLNKLVEAGVAEKTDVKVPGAAGQKTRTVKGYKRA